MENALAGQAAITPDGTAPKAYLNYIFLDKNFDPNNNHTGFERLPSGALNNYQLLQKEISIDREGFCIYFVAYESPYAEVSSIKLKQLIMKNVSSKLLTVKNDGFSI